MDVLRERTITKTVKLPVAYPLDTEEGGAYTSKQWYTTTRCQTPRTIVCIEIKLTVLSLEIGIEKIHSQQP
jgi:hypothetical protein